LGVLYAAKRKSRHKARTEEERNLKKKQQREMKRKGIGGEYGKLDDLRTQKHTELWRGSSAESLRGKRRNRRSFVEN